MNIYIRGYSCHRTTNLRRNVSCAKDKDIVIRNGKNRRWIGRRRSVSASEVPSVQAKPRWSRSWPEQSRINTISPSLRTIFIRRKMRVYWPRPACLPEERIIGVETGGCPHTAIREDASMNFEAVEELTSRFDNLDLIFIESGGDNLAAAFSPELVDRFIYIIDVAQGRKFRAKAVPASCVPIC